MSDYNDGDLVRHKPSGCVLFVNHMWGDGMIEVLDNNGEFVSIWSIKDCEPVTDKQLVDAGLYEAVKAACEEWNTDMEYPPTSVVGNIIKAFANSNPVEPQGWITDRRPTEDDAWNGDVLALQGDRPMVCHWKWTVAHNNP